MIDAMLTTPGLTLIAVGLIHVVWWTLGDLLLDVVGIPFLDAGWTRDSAWAMRPVTTLENGGQAHGEGDTRERREGVRATARHGRRSSGTRDSRGARPD